MRTTDHDAPRPYQRLTAEQIERVLRELLWEYRFNNLRPVPHGGGKHPLVQYDPRVAEAGDGTPALCKRLASA